MKNYKQNALALAVLLSTQPAFALAGFGGGIELRSIDPEISLNNINGDGENSISFALFAEHPIPLVPNVRIEHEPIKSDDFKYSKSSATAYYNFLDLDIGKLSAGLGYTRIGDTELNTVSGALDKDAVHIYLSGEMTLPMTGFGFYGIVQNSYGLEFSGIDAKIGARYTLLNILSFKPSLSVGYSFSKLNYSDVLSTNQKLTTNGIFVGARVAF